jgi:ABC-type Zn uptake system ZnuABC Zn-binding protein ZnuA
MRLRIIGILLLAAIPLAAQDSDKKSVACTLPILESIAREIGGDDFTYFSLGKADQDPHYIRPTPVLQYKLRQADLFLEVGLQLELWADQVANKCGRRKLQRGQEARIVCSRGVRTIQKPQTLSRAEGHVHPDGNPHIWLCPLRTKILAKNISEALISVYPEREDEIKKRLKAYRKRIDRAVFGEELLDIVGGRKLTRLMEDGELFEYLEEEEFEGKALIEYAGGWLKKAEPLRGKKVIEYHQVWRYLANLLGFEVIGSIEERPGIPPGPNHQLKTREVIRKRKVAFMLVDNFYSLALPQRISKDTDCPVVVVPNQPTGSYFEFIDQVIDEMLKVLKE